MSKQAAQSEFENSEVKSEIVELQSIVDSMPEASLLCEGKKNNPNYLSIIHANKNFLETFGFKEFEVTGKSYDFRSSDFDLDYSSEDRMEYVRLIRDVKAWRSCSVIVAVSNHRIGDIRVKITFTPQKDGFAIFAFEKLNDLDSAKMNDKTSDVFLRNLERTLRNERLLREVSSLIIDDVAIEKIAQNVAKILCEHLKTDRCLIHDYRDGSTNFVVEYHNQYSKPMFDDARDKNSQENLTKYINFQNHFYEKFGDKKKKSSLSIVEDVANDQNFLPVEDICKNFSIISQIAITTTFNGKINGGVYLHQADKRVWLEDEIELMEIIADQFSIALDRSNSIERVMIANHALMEKTSQLKEALKQEQEMRKMQNEFVALVSHEFKTPLQIIDSTRELLVRKIKHHNIADETIEKGFERIKSGIQRMNGLIHSTLNLAKMESGESKITVERIVFDLREFVHEIIAKSSNLAMNRNIRILTKIDELPQDFNGDSKLLDHSITNIISNAIKYSRSDSTVKIIARANDKKIALRVIDQGIGIPKEDLANIGKKFFRARNTLSVAGTGIGLYLTKHFIELHGGEVLIESEVNVGTSVTVILPRI